MTNAIKENQPSKEQQVLDFILSRPDVKNSPDNVLSAIEEYSQSTPLTIVGRQKGKYILDAIREKEPTIMIELGCYVGYSAILFGAEFAKQNERLSKMQNEPAKYYSFEINPDYATVARQIVDLAGLSDTVEIIVGAAGNMIPAFQERLQDQFGRFTPADFVFLDHAEEFYVPDLRVMESSSLIAPDTMIFADNIFYPGVPGYVDYVQGSPEYRRDYNERIRNISNSERGGRWNLLYESTTVPVENERTKIKDAIEITECVSYLSG